MKTIFRIRFRAEKNFPMLKKGEILEIFEDIFENEGYQSGYVYTGVPSGFSIVSKDICTGHKDSIGNNIYENDNILSRFISVDYRLCMRLEKVWWNPDKLQFFCGEYPLHIYQEKKAEEIITETQKENTKAILDVLGIDFNSEQVKSIISPFEIFGNSYDMSNSLNGKEDKFYSPKKSRKEILVN